MSLFLSHIRLSRSPSTQALAGLLPSLPTALNESATFCGVKAPMASLIIRATGSRRP